MTGFLLSVGPPQTPPRPHHPPLPTSTGLLPIRAAPLQYILPRRPVTKEPVCFFSTKERLPSDSDFPPAAAPLEPRLFVLPHKRAEQRSDSKQLRKHDQGTFGPFISAGFDHVTQMLFIGRPAAAERNIGLFPDANMKQRNVILVFLLVARDMRCSAACHREERPPSPGPQGPPGPAQPAPSSRGVTAISSRCALAPLQPQKWF